MLANKSTTVVKPATMMFGALLISAAVAQSVSAQESQRREGQRPAEERGQQRAEQQQRPEQSQMDKFERSDVVDELAEGVIVIKLGGKARTG